MSYREPPWRNRVRTRKKDTEAIDLLKEVFVCVTIPAAAFALAYIALGTFAQLFLG